MKPTLRPGLGQHLALTPQLRQAIRLLQLSSIELEAEVARLLDGNPLLERADEAEPDDDASGEGDSAETAAEAGPAADTADATGASDPADIDASDASDAIDAIDFDDGLDWHGRGDDDGSDGEDGDRPVAVSAPEDLHDHLYWQLHLTPMGARDRAIAVALIEAIGEDGYLTEPLDAIRASLRPEIDVTLEDMLPVLHRIQHFDPLGVGAIDLADCLTIQLGTLSHDTPGLALARRIAADHLEALARHGPERLAAELHADPAELAVAIDLLRSLDPRPGAQITPAAPEYIRPDCVVWREGGVWKVALAHGCQPQLCINRRYQRLLARASREDAHYLRGQLQEARWLIRSLQTRADTLLRVARCIVRQQSGFLDHGPEAMRPLTLRDVADELGLHESTVSRATARKYLRTPRGTFEFRHFFASGIGTGDGGAASSTAIQAMIRKLIEAEDPRRPLSDARMAAELKAAGIPVARRTVAKYREAMNIPSSNERQRLG
ncbi:RNA polymerase factor sigma-54 [Rehaibacterium terrae]|jgi:RNA polymerase sigma-54 factor|uniref:RNA polymerase sigma-54 factor n=1 Tax=Rehaibacterium terrae TaxID=1341696 RepID=A0A7W7V7A7_9GAMM|nr:RNA polymerase factor sigma-54 [Rehaibacterium terrae]MBB5014592.1 RNA polymerase sigma-54 factor [Rehaibacterium terrae]